MTEIEEDFEDIDLSDLDIDVGEPKLNLPQYPLVQFLKAHLESHTRISIESKKFVQRYCEQRLEEIIRELAIILKDFLEISNRKLLDIELMHRAFGYFEKNI